MLIPQLFHNLSQPVGRKSAHLYAAAGNRAATQAEVQFRSSNPGIFTIQLKEIAHLIQNQIIRVAFLHAVVFPYLRVRLLGLYGIFFSQRLFRLNFFILCLFFVREIAALLNQIGNPFGNCFPGKIHIRAAILFEVQTLSVVIFIAAHSAGQGMRVAAYAILALEKIHFFLVRMRILEKGKNAALAAFNAAAAGHGGLYLVLGDKLSGRRYIRQLRGKGDTGHRQLLQVFPNFSGLVVVEPQQIPVLLVSRPECGVFFRKALTKLRFIQLGTEPFCFFREPASMYARQAGKIPGFSGFLAEIVIQIP